MFFHDLLQKLADDLEHVGLAVLRDTPVEERVHTKAEFRAIEYEIDQLRKKNFPAEHPEAYAAVVASYRRIWSAARILDKMRANTHRDIAVEKPEMRDRPGARALPAEAPRAVVADLLEPHDGLAELPARAARGGHGGVRLLAGSDASCRSTTATGSA